MDSKVNHHLEEEVDIKKLNEKDSVDVDQAVSEDEKLNVDEENKVIPSREQRLEWFMSTFKNKDKLLADDEEDTYYDSDDGSHSLNFRDFASFELDMYESEGFDVQDYSDVNDAGMIRTYYDPAAGINPDAECLPQIRECAGQAIQQYNAEKGTHFVLENVIKTNVEPVSPYRFYITFDAIDGTQGTKENFQTVVDVHIPITRRTVTLVRVSQPPRFFLREDIYKEDGTGAPPCASCG